MQLGIRWGLAAPAVAAMLAAVACGTTMDAHSGEDALRAGASEIPLGAPIDDRLSAPQGDHTDWKSFTLGQDAEVTLEVWWDEPDVEARMAIRDQFAETRVSTRHQEGRRKDVVGPVALSAGQYFIELAVSDDASVYTLEIHTRATAAPRPGF